MNINDIIIASEERLREIVTEIITDHYSDLAHEKKRNLECEDIILTREQASKFLQVSLPTLHAWTQSKEIPSSRIGGRIYYSKNDLLNKVRLKGGKYGS